MLDTTQAVHIAEAIVEGVGRLTFEIDHAEASLRYEYNYARRSAMLEDIDEMKSERQALASRFESDEMGEDNTTPEAFLAIDKYYERVAQYC